MTLRAQKTATLQLHGTTVILSTLYKVLIVNLATFYNVSDTQPRKV